MNIEGISLSEFHVKKGFQLVASVPYDSLLTQEQFNLYSDLILPKQQLCERILAIEYHNNYFLVAFPLLSKNKKDDTTYSRQKYIYSLSILICKKDYFDKNKQGLYKLLIKKVALFFKVVEESSHIVYNHHTHINYIRETLNYVFNEVNERGKCFLTYFCTHYTFISLNYSPFVQRISQFMNSFVPITTLTEEEIEQIQNSFARKLLFYAYQGNYTLKKIYQMHRQHREEQIRQFYSRAISKGVVFMVDLFQFSNIYILTHKIQQYLPQKENYEEFEKQSRNIIHEKYQNDVTVDELFCLYLEFNRVTSLSKIYERNKKIMNKINIVNFIRTGQIYGFLERIHHKIVYSELPKDLVVVEQMRKILKERNKEKMDVSQKKLREEIEKVSIQLRLNLRQNTYIDEIAVSLQIQPHRLQSLITSQGRFLMQVRLTNQ